MTVLAALLLAGVVRAQTVTTINIGVNQAIPDANGAGLAVSTNLSGLSGTIGNVAVQLDISGGFNGDLYAYLVNPAGTMAVLLNRTGLGSAHPYGYSDAGFNITLDDSGAANNVHNYQLFTLPGGSLTGTWSADGLNISPLSTPGVFDAASPSAGLLALDGSDPNGVWTFFVADLSGGGQGTLVDFSLIITSVPEPQTWALGLSGGLALWTLARSRRKK